MRCSKSFANMARVARRHGELAPVQSAHVQHYPRSANGSIKPIRPDERLIDHLWDIDAEIPNARSALDLRHNGDFERMLDIAGAMAVFCHHRGYLGEGRFWLEQSLAAAEQATPETRGWGSGRARSPALDARRRAGRGTCAARSARVGKPARSHRAPGPSRCTCSRSSISTTKISPALVAELRKHCNFGVCSTFRLMKQWRCKFWAGSHHWEAISIEVWTTPTPASRSSIRSGIPAALAMHSRTSVGWNSWPATNGAHTLITRWQFPPC